MSICFGMKFVQFNWGLYAIFSKVDRSLHNFGVVVCDIFSTNYVEHYSELNYQ